MMTEFMELEISLPVLNVLFYEFQFIGLGSLGGSFFAGQCLVGDDTSQLLNAFHLSHSIFSHRHSVSGFMA